MDVAVIQEAVTDELKKVQKEEFSAAFQKLYDHTKACVYANRAYFELKKKKGMCLPHVYSIFKIISPKSFGSHRVRCAITQKSADLIVLRWKPKITHMLTFFLITP